MSKLKKFLFTFVLLFYCLCHFNIKLYAQAIRGVLIENSNQEPLPGASVQIKNQQISTVTNSAGYFEIPVISPGTYNLSIHEIGFKDSTIVYVVKDLNGPKLVIRLRESSSNLKEVFVKSRANHESEGNSRRKEKNANNVINVVSAETIKKSPDLNVADVAQRISGISLARSSDTKEEYVIVRGLSPRYNNTLINGIKIPSPDDKSRSVPLEIIPSELVGNLVISKTLTPDMEGDAVGGTVDVQLKDAPPNDLLEINLAGGFNSKVINGNSYTYNLGPVNKLDPSQRFGHMYSAVQTDFPSSILKFSQKKFTPNSIGSLTFGKRFLKNKLGVVFSASNQNTFSASSGTALAVNIGTDNKPYAENFINRSYSYQSDHLGLNAKVDYRFNENNRLSLIGTYLHSNVQQSFFATDTLLKGAGRGLGSNATGSGLVDSVVRARYSIQTLANFALQGKNLLTPSLTIDYTASYADSRAALPDLGSMTLYKTLPQTKQYIFSPNSTDHSWQRNFDKDYSAYFNAVWKSKNSKFPFEIKAGGLYRSKKRSNYRNSYTLNAINNNGSNTAAWYTSNFSDTTFRVVNPLGNPTINPDNYSADEKIAAGYIMLSLKLNKLSIVAGVRDENTNQSNHNENTNSPFNTIYNYFKYNDILPSINLKYDLTSNQNLRLSYYKGLNRPNYTEIVQYTTDNGNGYDKGNPNLKRSLADNFDLRYEYFPGIADALFLGGFYKRIYAPIERYVEATSTVGTTTFVNGNTATNLGLELELIKYFGRFGISGNYTFTFSSELRRKKFYKLIYDAQGNYINTIDTQPLERTPLEGQSKHIANVAFIYRDDLHHFNAQFSVLFQGKRIDGIQPYLNQDYYQSNYTTLSFSADKSVGKRLTLFMKLNNLNNAPYLVRTGSGFFSQKDYFGQDYLFGLRFKFL